ncbi:MAG TPA: outer membrane beta-barrel protein [Luteibaculaceae bacterium]|nr:outer membrane beta-barrel protein [Luteibaculaceae bacterium]
MIKKLVLACWCVGLGLVSSAQFPPMGGGGRGPGGGGRGMNSEQMNVGRFYGKITGPDGKPIEFATVQLNGQRWDSTAKAMKPAIMGGQITAANGDFSIEKLPPFGEFTLQVNAIGFKPYTQKVKFDLKFELGKPMDMQKALNAVDKDLGNIKLESSATLKEVVVEGGDPSFKMEIDKKIFNVDKNTVSAGGTAEDVLRTVPSVSVDMDGNVALRNAAPQIFVDGRPSSMTLEQIPADAIQSIELITNPSAKYDASGGMGGIINIVLKKNRKLGYNGGIRAGIDRFGKLNGGVDINLREGKINTFAMLFANQRRTPSIGFTDRINRIDPLTTVRQDNIQSNDGNFMFGRFGLDYFPDNRNTITLGFNLGGGGFGNEEEVDIRTDTTNSGSSFAERLSNNNRKFNNLGSNVSYKHLYPKAGKEITADVNYNRSLSSFGGDFNTQFFNGEGIAFGPNIAQRQEGKGNMQFITAQTDFVNPLSENSKIEAGLRANYNDYTSSNDNFTKNPFTNEFEKLKAVSNNFGYKNQVYAAYATYSRKINKFSFQTGLRLESSVYSGTLFLETGDTTFSNSFPASLFPSQFISYQIREGDDIQLSYTRKINRPNFFQLIPFIDYTDSLNLSRGNPDLLPEFTNSIEVGYLNTINSKNNVLISAYYKNTNGIITRYQTTEFNPVLNRDAIITTYANASQSYNYGAEVTFKNELKKWLDVTTNFNVFNAVIDGSNIEQNLRVERLAWFGKINANFRLPRNYSIQLTGEYKSRSAIPAGGGGGGGRGGFMGGGIQGSAQGYIREHGSVDISIRKDLFKNKMGNISIAVRDIFRTDINFTHSESVFFVQDTYRLRNPQYIRVNFSYRFGKFDVSLFKRKNMNNMDGGGMEMQGAM